MKRALILGIGGQDGSYLAELLLKEGCEVHGLARRSSLDNLWRIKHIRDRVKIHRGDLLDFPSLGWAVDCSEATEIYNMADQDEVSYSVLTPCYSADVTFKGVVNLLETLRNKSGRSDDVKVYQPVSATMFGNAPAPHTEQTPLDPDSPYAVAKAAAYHICRHYRRQYEMFISTGICYNHDSPRRVGDYLLQRIARGSVRIAKELKLREVTTRNPPWPKVEPLIMGDLNADVEVGFAGDYARAAYRILQKNKPDDYLLSTGKKFSVRSLVREAFYSAELRSGEWEDYVREDPGLMGNRKRTTLWGNSSKAIGAGVWDAQHNAISMVNMLVQHYKQHGWQ